MALHTHEEILALLKDLADSVFDIELCEGSVVRRTDNPFVLDFLKALGPAG